MISRIGDWFGWVIEPAVDRLHVSASNMDVVRACRQAMTRDARAREHRQARHEFMRAAIEHHQDNRRMFALRNAGFAVHEVALLMDDEKRQAATGARITHGGIDISKREERAIQAARDFANVVNEMGFDAKAFAKEIRREHRTIQQGVGGVILELLSQWADDGSSGNYDLRNAAICKIAAKMDPLNPGRLPYI